MGSMAVRLLNASPAGSEVGRRFAAWIAREPRKVMARQFGASERTVQSWREGVLPQTTTLVAMVDKWGAAFLEHIFAPVLAEGDLSVARRIERIESDVAALKQEFNDENAAPAVGADVRRGRGMVRQARRVAASAVAALLIGAAMLQQILPDIHGDDLARLRGGGARIVRVAGGGARSGRAVGSGGRQDLWRDFA